MRKDEINVNITESPKYNNHLIDQDQGNPD